MTRALPSITGRPYQGFQFAASPTVENCPPMACNDKRSPWIHGPNAYEKIRKGIFLNRWRDGRTRTVPAVPRLREAVVAPLAFICEERRPYQLRFMAGMRDLGIVEAPQSQIVRDSDEAEVAAVVAPLAFTGKQFRPTTLPWVAAFSA